MTISLERFISGGGVSSSATATTTMDHSRAAANNARGETNPNPALQDQILDPECSEAVRTVSKSLTSDSEESEDRKLNTTVDTEHAAAVTDEAANDSSMTKSRKQVDRSSCGSNTNSSSEVETDALGKQHEKVEESKEPDVSNPACDSSNRRPRISVNQNDSWKEVSQGGRLAFQALFSRERLPQSFSPPKDLMNNKDQNQNNIQHDIRNANADGKNVDASQLDLNTFSNCCEPVENNRIIISRNKNNEGMLRMGLGNAKLKTHQTGFKPYKRCSIEAKESGSSRLGNASANQDEEKISKRMRLEGGASA